MEEKKALESLQNGLGRRKRSADRREHPAHGQPTRKRAKCAYDVFRDEQLGAESSLGNKLQITSTAVASRLSDEWAAIRSDPILSRDTKPRQLDSKNKKSRVRL